jgi:hypothetical protein
LEIVNELPGVKELLMGGAGGGVDGDGERRKRSAGKWGVVASVLEGAGKVKDTVGMLGGLAGGLVKKRATEFIVRGR